MFNRSYVCFNSNILKFSYLIFYFAHPYRMVDFPTFLTGLNPPFLVRNLEKSIYKTFNRCLESECAIFTILENQEFQVDSKMTILAVIYTNHFHYTKRIALNDPLVVFHCFDEIQLFIYNGHSLFSARLICCRNWDFKYLKAVNISNNSDSITISISIKNAKFQNDYHYNIVERPMLPVILNGIDGKYQCPLCLVILPSAGSIARHAKYLHPKYLFEILNDVITVKRNHVVEDEVKPVLSTGIDFCSPFICPVDDSTHYIDFCSGLSIKLDETSDENFTEKYCLEDFEGRKSNVLGKLELDRNSDKLHLRSDKLSISPKISYISAKLPTDLCRLIKKHRENGREMLRSKVVDVGGLDLQTHSNGSITTDQSFKKSLIKTEGISNISILFIQPFEVKGNSKPHTKFNNSHKCYLTVLINNAKSSLNEKYIKSDKTDFIFYKRRSTILIDYSLENYGLSIEKEYDTIDYTDMIANHLNIRLDQHMKNGSLKERQYEIMKTWNKLMVEYKEMNQCLEKLLNIYGINESTVEMLELLYSRGLANSEEIANAINSIEQ